MGQWTNGILFGCESPNLPNDYDGEAADGLVERWEKASDQPAYDWRKPQIRIRVEHEGGKKLIGVWVAVGGSGEDGVPYFMEKAMLLADVSNVYSKQIAKAKELWQEFAAWVAENEKIELTAPDLWLTPCETA